MKKESQTSKSQNVLTLSQEYQVDRSKVLGQGSTGEVYMGREIATDTPVAVKMIRLETIDNEVTEYLLRMEKMALMTLKHSNVLKGLKVIQNATKCYMVTEFLSGGTLKSFIRKQGKLKEEKSLEIIQAILKGYSCLVRNGVVHRDLKPANIMLTEEGIIKIIDFGYCEIEGYQKPSLDYNVGSPSYMAPESFESNIYNEKTEIWAIGIILYECLMGKTFDEGRHMSEIYRAIKKYGIPFGKQMSDNCRQIISKCLQLNPSKRPTALELISLISKLKNGSEENPGFEIVSQTRKKSNSIAVGNGLHAFQSGNLLKKKNTVTKSSNNYLRATLKSHHYDDVSSSAQTDRNYCLMKTPAKSPTTGVLSKNYTPQLQKKVTPFEQISLNTDQPRKRQSSCHSNRSRSSSSKKQMPFRVQVHKEKENMTVERQRVSSTASSTAMKTNEYGLLEEIQVKAMKPALQKMFKTEKRISNCQPIQMNRVGSSYLNPPSAFNSGVASPKNSTQGQKHEEETGNKLCFSTPYREDRATNPESLGRNRINSTKVCVAPESNTKDLYTQKYQFYSSKFDHPRDRKENKSKYQSNPVGTNTDYVSTVTERPSMECKKIESSYGLSGKPNVGISKGHRRENSGTIMVNGSPKANNYISGSDEIMQPKYLKYQKQQQLHKRDDLAQTDRNYYRVAHDKITAQTAGMQHNLRQPELRHSTSTHVHEPNSLLSSKDRPVSLLGMIHNQSLYRPSYRVVSNAACTYR